MNEVDTAKLIEVLQVIGEQLKRANDLKERELEIIESTHDTNILTALKENNGRK